MFFECVGNFNKVTEMLVKQAKIKGSLLSETYL